MSNIKNATCRLTDKQPRVKTLAKPCPSCPWRLDQGAQDIPGFSLEQAEGLSACCPDERGFGPDFGAPMFACHQCEGGEFHCAGWLATVGRRHPLVRLSVAMHEIPAERLEPGEDWPELHGSYGEVLEKLRASVHDDAQG